jgi:hypothetical protein
MALPCILRRHEDRREMGGARFGVAREREDTDTFKMAAW